MDAPPLPCTVPAGELLLRPWTVADASQVEAIATDPQIATWNPLPQSDAAQWCTARADWSDGTHTSWAVVHGADPVTVVGAISLHHLDYVQLDGELGYWVAPAHRRRRVATSAVSAASGFGFEQLGLHRIHLFHAVENTASCAVAASAGFAYEGTHRQSYRSGNAPWHDEHSHARLSTD